MNVHIIGICGKGTSATALLLKQKGWTVTGSDSGSFEPIATALRDNDIKHTVGYDASNIPENVDLIILGSSAQLSIENNEEVAKAMSLDNPKMSFAEILGDLTKETNNLVIVGSYGKSTCSSLAAHIMKESGKDPSYFLGAEPKDFGTSHIGKGEIFILEGDEYPHDSKSLTPKFLFYNPKSILLISGEHDHINKFPTVESYLKPYKDLLKIIPERGVIVAGINHPNVSELVNDINQKVFTYGLEKADYTPDNISYGEVSSFDLQKDGKYLTSIKTNLLGDHNIENIVGVSALLLENNLVTIDELANSIQTFKGVKNRLELKNPNSIVPVYESFGSSYKKAKADISAIKKHFPDKNIIAIFEPHTFGWRNKGNLSWYIDVFEDVSKVVVYKPSSAGNETPEQLSLSDMVKQINLNEDKAVPETKKGNLPDLAKSTADENSIILLITSSDFDGQIEKIVSVFK
ncbi:MAG: UDP-N-acetylmuramate: L-alanyl-gamma-D-glutamyl-meso-diaminopimelate ligase [Candidatus Paceibacteria bacterium]|jgi:UDP-N-acetylmuramate: L-alanyl-gamma-D-glutamyl-meso-diaminopimelate ligase